MKWQRGESSHVVRNDAGEIILRVLKLDYCGFWYVYVGIDQDEADGTRFNLLWEAKAYAERQVAKGRVSVQSSTEEEKP